MWLYIKFGQAGTACVGDLELATGTKDVQRKWGPSRETKMTLALLSNQAFGGEEEKPAAGGQQGLPVKDATKWRLYLLIILRPIWPMRTLYSHNP